jgi:NAD(P)-dependent dehydrogenase (short-subunit alcohol dehydrogenase family)
MQVLVLGGTQFVGRAIVDALLAAGHSVTLTNRGRSAPTASELWGDRVEFIAADRLASAGTAVDDAGHSRLTGDLQELAGRSWDVAIDVNCYLPLAARKMAVALEPVVGFICFISTVSVYDVDDASFAAASTPDGLAALAAAGGVAEGAPLLPFLGSADPHSLTSQSGSAEELGENSCELKAHADQFHALNPRYTAVLMTSDRAYASMHRRRRVEGALRADC